MDKDIIASLLETINCAIIIVDLDGTIILANTKAKEIFCHSRKNCLEGTHISSIFLPDDHEIFVPNIIKITRQKGEFYGEAMLQNMEGRHFYALLSTSICPLNDREGLVFTIHDITNLKHIEKLLKDSERLAFWGRMLDDISHQIRNPVLTIGGFARRLKRYPTGHSQYADVILKECKRLELFLDGLNRFLRLPKPKPRPLKIEECMECLHDPVEEITQRLSGTISWEYGPVPRDLKVLVDVELMAKAIIAVVENALESYTDDVERDRKVTVRLNTPQGTKWACRITISDMGTGIRPTVLPKVFDPFFSTKTGHIGMGLTIAKRIVDELAGEISIDTQWGTGTDVNIFLLEDRRRPVRRKNNLDLEEQVTLNQPVQKKEVATADGNHAKL